MALVNLGAAHHSQQRQTEALDYFVRALSLAEEAERFETQADAHCWLGSVYGETGESDRAHEHLWQSVQISQRVGSRFYEAEALLQLGLTEGRLALHFADFSD